MEDTNDDMMELDEEHFSPLPGIDAENDNPFDSLGTADTDLGEADIIDVQPEASTGLATLHTEPSENFEITPVGIRFHGPLTDEQFARLITWTGAAEKAAAWWVGDVLNYGEKHHEKIAQQIVDANEWSEETVRNYRWVCAKVPIENRLPGVTFGHYQLLAALKPKEQARLAGKVAAENLTTANLRAELFKAEREDGKKFTALWLIVQCKDAKDQDELADKMTTDGRVVKLSGEKVPNLVKVATVKPKKAKKAKAAKKPKPPKVDVDAVKKSAFPKKKAAKKGKAKAAKTAGEAPARVKGAAPYVPKKPKASAKAKK